METLLQMILPGVVAPFILSVIAWVIARKNTAVLAIASLAWLPSYFWISGWPPLFPAEARHWLWLLLIASVAINYFFSMRTAILAMLQAVLLLLVTVSIAWPVLRYQLSLSLILEIIVLTGTAYLLYRRMLIQQPVAPGLSMAISSGGMGLVVALAGSLLLGQLAGAIASVLAIFALTELFKRQTISLGAINLLPFIQLYLALLIIARIFAELALLPSLLLLAAPVIALLTPRRFAPVLALVSITIAVSWLLLTTDSSGYY